MKACRSERWQIKQGKGRNKTGREKKIGRKGVVKEGRKEGRKEERKGGGNIGGREGGKHTYLHIHIYTFVCTHTGIYIHTTYIHTTT